MLLEDPVGRVNSAHMETAGTSSSGQNTNPLNDFLQIQDIHIVILGAQGVGKTSLAEQFVYNHFCTDQKPTRKRKVYYPSIIINDHLYKVRITDSPHIPYFPQSSLNEWTDFPGYYGLRNATAYILVFDITNDESFQYVRSMREQILDVHHDVHMLVIANKHDLNEDRQMPRREVAATVKKHWKCSYIETSAKYNWHVETAFKEVMKMVDCGDVGHHKPAAARVQDALRRNSCTIL